MPPFRVLVIAWLYGALRVVHSIVQATVNILLLRFAVFNLDTLVLQALTIRASLVVF